MRITKIEKKKRLYLLELDSQEKCYITEDTVVRFMLSKGMDISVQEFKEIREFAQFSYGKNLALYHISFKQRTRKEVQDYLVKHDIEDNLIPTVLDQLEKENWINDLKIAQLMVEQNASSGDKGPFVLAQKMAQKGIAKFIIAQVLDDLDFSEIAERVSQKLYRKYEGKLPLQAVRTKLLQQLTTKGFTSSQAKEAIQNLDLEKDQEQEEKLIFKELEKQERKYARKYEGYELKQRITQALARKGYSFDDIRSALREYF